MCVCVCVCVFLCIIASNTLRPLQCQTHSIKVLITGWKYQLYKPYSPGINREREREIDKRKGVRKRQQRERGDREKDDMKEQKWLGKKYGTE